MLDMTQATVRQTLRQSLPLSENARTVLSRRYLRKGPDGKPVETAEQMFSRVAHAIARRDGVRAGADPDLARPQLAALLLVQKARLTAFLDPYADPQGAGWNIIQSLTAIGFIAMLVVPALAHRFGWLTVPLSVAVAGDVLVALGFLIIFFVYKENSFASAIIEVVPEQEVISTGPYALVRHPMYLGGLVLFLGIPLSLGSWWGFCVIAVMMPALIWRLLDEEKFLAKNLPGYAAYRKQVKYRLVPFIF